MSSADITIEGEGSTSELAPVQEWVAEMGQRLDCWSKSAKAISAEEWSKLRGVMAGTFAKSRVEGVLRDVLSRVGIRAKDEELDAMVEELRRRVLSYRAGETIESYA
ncbi:MAG: hypothetical protein AAF488_07130, partial [Planctomycetota bacterium]